MGIEINKNSNSSPEIQTAIEALEKHINHTESHYWIFAVTTAILSLISVILYITLNLEKLILTPFLPIIFGFVGFFKSLSVTNKIFSLMSAILGILFIVFVFLYK